MSTVTGEVLETADETTSDTPSTAPTLAEVAARFGAIQAADDEWKSRVAQMRANLYDQLVAARESTGGALKSAEAKYDDGLSVTYTLKGSSERFTVTDREAFKAWVEQHFPTEVEFVVQVNPAFEKQLLDKYLAGAKGAAFPKDITIMKDAGVVGAEVPGVTHTPASDEPNGFGSSWKGGKDAKAAALASLSTTSLGGLLGLTDGTDQ